MVVAGLSAAGVGEEAIQLKEGPGRDLTLSRCITCHSLDYIEMNAAVLDRAGWQKTIRKMTERFGAFLSDQEAAEILEYLSANYSARPVLGRD